MHKVIVERPRGGQGWARQFRRPRLPQEDLPKCQGMKRPHKRLKWFGEHLGPLKRWLRSQVGRRWNEVYSEACTVIKPDNVVRAHIRTHMLDYVERNTFMRDGVVWCFRRCERNYEVPVAKTAGRWRLFYVHPETGLLLEIPRLRRSRRKPGYYRSMSFTCLKPSCCGS